MGKVRLVTARTDTRRCEEKKGNFALMCDHAENNEQSVCVCHLEQLHQSLQLYHQLPPALLQR